MTDAAASPTEFVAEAPLSPLAEDAPRPWVAQVMLDTVGYRSARIGLWWIGAVAFFAVFAPVIANSYPMLVKLDGKWSSPMLANFTPVDVTLLLLTLVGVPVLLMRLPTMTKALVIGATLLVVGLLSLWLVRPPQLHVYEQYREAQQARRIQFMIRAPIPFSPTDRLR